MIQKRAIKIFFVLFIFGLFSGQAQERDSLSQQFLMNAEIRPRAEYTSNYTLPPNTSADPYFYITQRNRISMQYERAKWLIKSDVQEIHLWDKENSRSKIGSLNFYQLFLETKFKSVNIRLGRQSILLDNGRLFSDAPWAQQGRAHEGIRLMKQSERFSNDFFFLFTRNYNTEFEPAYSPVAANRYKYMLVNSFSYNSKKAFSFNSISAVDFLESTDSEQLYTRATTGGRVDFKTKNWNYTLNSYLQFGHNQKGQKLFAYYFQPEIKLSLEKSNWRLGAEIISGSSAQLSADHSGDFDVLYGVTWKFNGNMNVFTRFPTDVGSKGLINPYLFTTIPLHPKLSIRTDFHLFYTQYHLKNELNQNVKKFLGFENDISLKYNPIKALEVNCAFSFYQSVDSMKYLPKIQDENKTAFWSYLMVSYSFNALNIKRYKNQSN
ncbi:alginate export family protein [Flavobacterium pectinovorum]|uniref:alginate export family protein n=1 Tax=Flavobacterium pectinovorum TaxID=29533 RepID=UPI001FAC3A26|nr:alginate export family protein [Flavobacterium pectinovorum]MCI9845039.1 alginate export family protein [Flavobacterium pectinovorum]